MSKDEEIKKIAKDVKEHQCSLRATCIQAVPGYGNANTEVVFIGEAPGRSEDEQGKPFVGAAGKLLDKLLSTIGLKREDIYITNIVKCRPPGNRDPKPEEVAEHAHFLTQELDIIKPKLIVLLGRHALNRFMPNEKISAVRGKAKRKDNQVYFPIYHPAAALHNPNFSKILEDDFKKIPILLKKIDELSPQVVQSRTKPEAVKITQETLI